MGLPGESSLAQSLSLARCIYHSLGLSRPLEHLQAARRFACLDIRGSCLGIIDDHEDDNEVREVLPGLRTPRRFTAWNIFTERYPRFAVGRQP